MNSPHTEEEYIGVRRDGDGNVDRKVYEFNTSLSPLSNINKYLSFKKVNTTEKDVPYSVMIAKDERASVYDMSRSFTLPAVNRKLDALKEKLFKSNEGDFYEIFLDKDRLENDFEQYSLSEQKRVRNFSSDLIAHHGLTDKPWANDVYHMAYEEGHSSGLDEIANCIIDLVDLANSVEEQSHVAYYKKKTEEAYHLIKDVVDSLPSGQRGSLDWLNPDTETNMRQFASSVGRIVDPQPVEDVHPIVNKASKTKNKAKLKR